MIHGQSGDQLVIANITDQEHLFALSLLFYAHMNSCLYSD